MAKVSMTKMSAFVMKKAAQTKRFADIKLSRYVNDIDLKRQSQFSVLCVGLPDESIFVAYSGTDSTIVGWRENFNMGYLEETPGQRKAVNYLNYVMEKNTRTLRIGGHSKGGNLSVFAAVMCEPAIQRHIVAVYSNDGPGFHKEIIESPQYQKMEPLIRRIVPESSIVGLLLEHDSRYEVVKSTEHGVAQHDPMSWEVLGKHFVYGKEVAPESLMLDKTMKNWLEQLNEKQRQEIVETAFSVLEEANVHTVDDFYNSKLKKIQEIIKATSNLPEDTQKLFSRAVRLLWKSGNEVVKQKVKETMDEKKNS
ncbi:MAG: Mbeg1-like protein [Roseburia sp.]|nr:Mbeg1-like protein [Roseburia sp.]